ncbi:MAG: ATP-binding protein [Myxococcota bacterium]
MATQSTTESRLADSPKLATLIEVLEHSPAAAYLLRAVDNDFVLEAVNATARAISPALETMLGRPVSLLYRDQPEIIADAWRCLHEKKVVVREILVRRHDRVEANQKQRLTFVFVEPDRLVIHARELEEVGNAQAALKESQERYRSLVASVPDAVLIRGADGRVLACNDVAVELCGRTSQADLMGQLQILGPGVWVEDEHGQRVPETELPSFTVIRSGVSVKGRLFTQVRADGTRKFVRVSVEPLRASTGAVAGSVTLYTDETVRITAERAVRETADRLEFALDAARMGTWEWQPGTDKGRWSSSLFRHFDIAGCAPGFAGFLERVHADDVGPLSALASKLSQGAKGETFEHEFRIVGNDGVTRWARVRGRIEHAEGDVRMVGTLMDVTERRLLEEELLRAHRLESIGRLAGGLAHDFNNLLAAMLGSLELLAEVCPPAGRDDLATARHAAERARDLTAQLLAFARKQPIVLGNVDLGQLVENIERMLRRLVGPTIELAIQTERGLTVRADAAQLEQVLVNLAVNARDAMPHGGVLNVRVRADRLRLDVVRDVVVLEVEDQGSGMDAETIRHVFDPFFTTKDAGTGLGLASSYGIVQQHGGDILVESEPGHGARFCVVLPRSMPSTSVRVEPAGTASGAGCILVVDDEDAVRKTTGKLLKSLGYDVVLASSGDEAVNIAATHPLPIDLLLCDVAMPDRSGPDVAREVMRLRPKIRTLLVSGYPEGAESSLESADFLQKPYTRAALGRKLRAMLGTPENEPDGDTCSRRDSLHTAKKFGGS